MTVYAGERTVDGPVITRDGAPLDPATTIAHFWTGDMDWGCTSPLSQQLALALLMDHLGDPGRARRLVDALVARLDNEWWVDDAYMGALIDRIEKR